MKKIAILGSTGSIGTQTVDILPSIDAEVVALTTNRRINLLEEQARALHPKMVCAMDENAAKALKIKLADTDIEVLTGMDGLIACAAESGADIVVTA
ncbi:MAG: 1-deoxy-D-xylulose-5-phosphate reductoisomerase, partial [Agathobaculum butyriciproducens]